MGTLSFPFSNDPLELQTERELHFARRRRGAGDDAKRTGQGEVGHTTQTIQRQREAWMVESIEGFRVEFQVEALVQLEVLDERQVRVGKVRAMQIVARSHLQSKRTGE